MAELSSNTMTGDFEKQTTPSLYWATIGYAESWWTIDADNLKRIETLGGQLTVHILECIAREYNVIRGLAPKKRECLQGILNTAAEHWPVEKPNGEENLLIERACQCTKIMETTQRKGCFTQRNGIPTNQISAITKFMWFLRPENWTLYDKFASDGLGVRQTRTADRMHLYYKQLSDRKFGQTVSRMQQDIDRISCECETLPRNRCLPATRIVDRFMMEKGKNSEEFEEKVRQRRHFLKHGPYDKSELCRLAHRLEKEHWKSVDNLRKS